MITLPAEFGRGVMRFPRNDGTYAAPWVCDAAKPSRNQMT
jgi:hypothetical protein